MSSTKQEVAAPFLVGSGAEVFRTPAQDKARADAYDNYLVERFQAGLPMGTLDKRDARRLIKARKAGA